jgi:hypothetical protein
MIAAGRRDGSMYAMLEREAAGGWVAVALALIGKLPAEEVSANLHWLKQVMETGHVTDTSDAVAGKFARG